MKKDKLDLISRTSGEKGSVLLIVLWTVSLLALLALGAGFQSWLEAKLTVFQIDGMKEKRLCLATVELVKRSFPAGPDVAGGTREIWMNNPSLFKMWSYPMAKSPCTEWSPLQAENIRTFSVSKPKKAGST